MSEVMSNEEWLTAIEEALTPQPGKATGLTFYEIRALSGLGENKVYELLRKFNAQGRLIISKKSVTAIDGRPQTVPCYSIRAVQ